MFFNFLQPQPVPSNSVPPASRNCINTLPHVKVTVDDLLEETNKECLVCLEQHKIGNSAVKLPCGHLYHKNCLVEWLEKHATCPVCRYELETNDFKFEEERVKRMKKRKLRILRSELEAKSVSKLRELTSELGINIYGCTDKRDIIEQIIRSKKIEVTEGAPAIKFTLEEFQAKGVRELQHLLLSFGLSSEGAIEKFELQSRLLDSGRVLLISDPEINEITPDEKIKAETKEKQSEDRFTMSRIDLDSSTIATLRSLCQQAGLNMVGCVDKRDLAELLVSKGVVRITPSVTDEKIKAEIKEEKQSEDRFTMSRIDLNSSTIATLRSLCQQAGLNMVGCVDKRDLAELLVSKGVVRITPSVTETDSKDGDKDQNEEHFGSLDSNNQDYSNLSQGSRGFGLEGVGNGTNPADGKDMRGKSIPKTPESPKSFSASPFDSSPSDSSSFSSSSSYSSYGSPPSHRSFSSSHSGPSHQASFSFSSSFSTSSSSSSSPSSSPSPSAVPLSLSMLNSLSLKELIHISHDLTISLEGCVEREDIIDRLRGSSKVTLVS